MLGFEDLMMTDSSAFRYWKLEATTSGTLWIINEISYIANGIQYPTSPMTTDTTPAPLVVTASSYYASRNPYKAFDRQPLDVSNCWQSDDANPWIRVDLGPNNLIAATAISITINDTASGPNNFVVRASVDGSTWITKLTVGSAGWSAPNQEKTWTFTS